MTLRASHRLLPSPPSSALQCAPSRGGQHCCSRGSNPVAPAIRGVAKLCRGVPIRGLVGVPRWYECCRGIVCLVLSKSILPYPRHHPACVHPPTGATLPHPPSPGATRPHASFCRRGAWAFCIAGQRNCLQAAPTVMRPFHSPAHHCCYHHAAVQAGPHASPVPEARGPFCIRLAEDLLAGPRTTSGHISSFPRHRGSLRLAGGNPCVRA